MRLCVDARMMRSSGIGTFLRHLVPLIAKKPFEVVLLGEDFQGLMSSRFTCPVYSLSEQIYFPCKIPSCDVFWSPHYNTPWLSIRARRRVVTIHDVCHLALGSSWLKQSISRFLLKRACKQSDRIATVSFFSQSEIFRYLKVPRENTYVIHPGVDMEEFSPQHKTASAPFFLFVGNLKAHKNLSLLIRAFEHLSLKNYRLVIAGKKEGLRSWDQGIEGQIERSALRKQIDLLGEVSQDELKKLYASASAFVFPSFYEGFGLPPLEAMASGCPVLASSAASLPEACGEAALYFSPYCLRDLADQMKRVVEEPELREKLIQKGLERASHFSWEHTADQYRNLFLDLQK